MLVSLRGVLYRLTNYYSAENVWHGLANIRMGSRDCVMTLQLESAAYRETQKFRAVSKPKQITPRPPFQISYYAQYRKHDLELR